MKKSLSLLALSLVIQAVALNALAFKALAFDDKYADGAYLDPAYKNLKHPVVSDRTHNRNVENFFLDLHGDQQVATDHSDTIANIAHQTPIRNQAARGTCSIFSSTAAIESMMLIKGHAQADLDLSEEWLEYLVTRVSDSEGSDAGTNFNAILDNGDVSETALPYIGETWDSVSFSDMASLRCGGLSGTDLSKCLLGHRNPALLTAPLTVLAKPAQPLYDLDFLNARKAATAFKKTFAVTDRNYGVSDTADIKALLDQGIPVVLGISFYYGAWNHRGGAALGMTRNMDDWAKGIVFYPEEGSIDRDRSPEDPDGHSILVVGYDDSVTLTKAVEMSNGTTQTFTRKGVYYFKNSWGTDSFGVQATINGVSEPGYGTMSQDYGNEFGQFYKLPLE